MSAASDDTGKTVNSISFLFVASKDEPGGIPDDFFLLRALIKLNKNVTYIYRLWSELTNDSDSNQQRPQPSEQQLIIIRSLWEGRTRQGTSAKLLQFFAQTAEICPQMRNDYLLLDWTAHKSYLLHLDKVGVKIVPTCFIPSSNVDQRGLSLPQIDPVESSPGSVKREMLAHGWTEAILKPAVGTRCEGVMRLSLEDWSLSMAFAVASLLKEGDCVLQPFFPPVAVAHTLLPPPCHSVENAAHNNSIVPPPPPPPPSLLGELCVLCIKGEIAHAVHKNPSLWGWHESSCVCSGSVSDLETSKGIASCTCKSTLAQQSTSQPVVGNISISQGGRFLSSEDILPDTDVPEDVANMLKRAPVDSVLSPLPEDVVTTVHKVLDIIRHRSDGQLPFMCRLDFLPRWRQHSATTPTASSESSYTSTSTSNTVKTNDTKEQDVEKWQTSQAEDVIVTESTEEEGVEWLFSEVEGQWCEGFFRAAPESVFEMFLAAATASTPAVLK